LVGWHLEFYSIVAASLLAQKVHHKIFHSTTKTLEVCDYSEIKKIRDYSEIISQEAGKALVPTHNF